MPGQTRPGQRVKLAAHAKRNGRWRKTTGQIVPYSRRLSPSMVYVLRDGWKYPEKWSVRAWDVDDGGLEGEAVTANGGLSNAARHEFCKTHARACLDADRLEDCIRWLRLALALKL